MSPGRRLEARASSELDEQERAELRRLLHRAFEGSFSDQDFAHCLGGTHLLLRLDGELVSHASVVPRRLYVGDEVLRCGYVEAVATVQELQRHGLGGMLMQAARGTIERRFEVGALSTGVPEFYEPLGWRRWRGPSFVASKGGRVRTVDEDDGVMVLLAPGRPLELHLPIAVDERPGDSW